MHTPNQKSTSTILVTPANQLKRGASVKLKKPAADNKLRNNSIVPAIGSMPATGKVTATAASANPWSTTAPKFTAAATSASTSASSSNSNAFSVAFSGAHRRLNVDPNG